MWILWRNQRVNDMSPRMEHFNANSMTVLPIRPFADEALVKSREFAYRAERAAFCEVLTRHGAVPQGMAADLALMMFP
jgi:hypothetical protein